MSKQRLIITLLFPLLLLLIGCSASQPGDELKGRISIWHSWSPAEAIVLEQALAEFQEIHPKVNIITFAIPEDKILDEFIDAGNDGLAPGILLGSDSWIGELVNTGLIRSISIDASVAHLFDTRNTALSQYNEKHYGVPLFLEPNALYYNKNMVTSPPRTLDDLLQEADAGNHVAFVPRFEQAYWGIQTFGQGLFDGQDRFILDESGFQEWLSWLDEAQIAPGVILNVDNHSLLELFTSGQVAYYVAGPEKQAEILANIDEENPFEIGVVPLPEGPQGPAGPLLPAESIMAYTFTSKEQTRIAKALATFLMNQQQGIRFMRELDRLPANPTIRVDGRVYPFVHGFAQQARTAVVLPNELQTAPLVAAGDRAYISVLSGALTPEEAVCQFGQEVVAFQGYSAADVSLPAGCSFPEE